MITKIDNYCLNQSVERTSGLKEFTLEEYEMFELAGIKRMLKDEKIFHGKDVIFNNITWNTVIGASEGKIYKISL